MEQRIKENQRYTPVLFDADILVAGGGIAGIAAALAAARHGKKVCLVEREYALGGLATLGLIAIYLPLCDGRGQQLVYGIGEELLRLSIKYGADGRSPDAWLNNGSAEEKLQSRYMVQFNPQLFALNVEKLLSEAGVDILYGTLICDAIVENGLIRTLIVENKSGRGAVNVSAVIDCTGDADICKLAGAETVLYSKGNGLASWYYYFTGEDVKLKMFGLADVVREKDENNGASYDAAKTESLDSGFRFSGVDGIELSRAVLRGHSKMLDDILSQKKDNVNLMPVTMSTIPLVRMSRRLAGCGTADISSDHQYVPDSIGMTGDWRRRGPAFELPFSAMHCGKIRNLLAAGRCISVTDAMWDITRVIPPCAVTGQAAGTAAAIDCDFSRLDISTLQHVLTCDGVKLHMN